MDATAMEDVEEKAPNDVVLQNDGGDDAAAGQPQPQPPPNAPAGGPIFRAVMPKKYKIEGKHKYMYIDYHPKEEARTHRNHQAARQHRAIYAKCAMSHVQTGAHYCVISWPATNQISSFCTAGSCAEFIQLFVRTLEARDMQSHSNIAYSLGDVYDRFSQEGGGIGNMNDSAARFASLGLSADLITRTTRVYADALGRAAVEGAGGVDAGAGGGVLTPEALAQDLIECLEAGLNTFCTKHNAE